ncbi:MAG: hypothetical protein ACLQPH_14375 [Acidimicrobiales bacterium]
MGRPAIPFLLAAAGMVSWSLSLGSIHPYEAGAIGLVSQLSILWWLGLALAAAAIVWELRRSAPRWPSMVVGLCAFALILHGTLPATEVVPRFSTAYDVAGFSEYLGRTGQALPRLDVRMSWPAMFAAAGMAARAMGVNTLWFLRWCPLVLNLAYLLPLKAIANTCLRTSRARWAVLGIFLASNWIDQDYFSPQGLNLFLFLVAVAIVIRVFSAGGFPPRAVAAFLESRPWAAVKRLALRMGKLPYGAVRGEEPDLETTPRHRLAMLAVLLVVLGASAVSHQITPAALCLVFFGLAVTGRTGLRMLWLLMACLVWAWLSWEGHAYWSDHLAKVFGSAGQVGSTLNATVAARLQGSTPDRQFVQLGRILAAAITWLGALVGFVALWRRGRTLWTMVIVAVFPVAVAGAVSYGGEVALRVLLFSLAPAAVLTASLIDHRVLTRASVTMCLAISVALVALFPLVRFGNESFEAITPDDLAAAAWIHAHVAAGADVYIANRDEPLEYTDVGTYKLIEAGGLVTLKGTQLSDHLPLTHRPTYVYLTRSQDNYGVDFLGYRSGWMADFIDQLLKSGDVHVVFKNSTAIVLRIEKSPPPKHPRPNPHPHTKSHAPVKPAPQPKPVPVPRPKPTPTTRPKPTPTTRPKPSPTTTRPKPPPTTTTTPPTTTTTTTSPRSGT